VKAILKSVSRSFYLTIRFLPRPLREPVALAYLLARATDTIADTATIPVDARLTTLRDLARVIAGELDFSAVEASLREFAEQQSQPNERRLIENLRACFDWLERVSADDREDIRAVLQTIVRGQQLDLERFADPTKVTALRTSAELDEYTWLVAGCVGQFWTRLGFRLLPAFANRSPDEMTKLGIDYGKGLQLINVLRDRPVDLSNGRDYLPADELATAPLQVVFSNWLERAEEQIGQGMEYCVSLTNWRVRFATALPALLGKRTLILLREAGPEKANIKIARKEVRRITFAAALGSISPIALRTLFDRL
jgi:farnesyl-diphosphate farnesyltransferase